MRRLCEVPWINQIHQAGVCRECALGPKSEPDAMNRPLKVKVTEKAFDDPLILK